MGKEKPKQGKWCKGRHRLVRNILCLLLLPYAKLVYGLRVEKYRDPAGRPHLILYNHQTAFDQFFVGMAFRGAVYYLASEDLFSNGFVSSLIRFLVAPIPIKKQALDIGAIKQCLRVAREGGAIAIAPEGNRTYSGQTGYMSPAIAPLARRLGMPIALYRIEGGYGVHPRWSDVVRKGRMRCYVSEVIEPEVYAALSDEALYERIRDGLFVDEACADATFSHRRRAEYIERLLYVCPFCGLTRFESHGTRFVCTTCGREVEYQENKELHGVGFSLPFRFVGDWYAYQNEFVSHLETDDEKAIYCDEICLSEVIVEKRKRPLRASALLRLYGDRITIDEGKPDALQMPFADVWAIAVLGRNKLNVYYRDTLYQIKGDKRFNAVKYVNLFHHHKNRMRGDDYGKFLGL